MKVIFSPEAEKDLEHIADYIGRDSPRRSISFVNELVDSVEQIVEMPHGYSLVAPFEAFGVRRKPHGSYAIFYNTASGDVGILRILHAARDYEAILAEDIGGPE